MRKIKMRIAQKMEDQAAFFGWRPVTRKTFDWPNTKQKVLLIYPGWLKHLRKYREPDV